MRIFLSRHGNTFAPGDPVVCAGAKNDLPLVASGKMQAQKLAEYFEKNHINLTAVYCGPLQRTIEYAQIAVGTIKPIIDPRLNELDYGDWTGLTSQQIIDRFGQTAWENWEKNSLWPITGHWGSSEEKTIAEVQSFADNLTKKYSADDTVLVISSNGRLRYFLTLIPGAFETYIQQRIFKVATGNTGEMVYNHKQWSLTYWNIPPERR
jgi:broad specificity phosphatase PhoE